MFGPPSPLIENYLRETGFWHVANIGWGCKLDPKLSSAFIERWRFETHTFHLPYGECTITLEDVQLQLGLPMDGFVFTGSVQSIDWGAICYDFLGAILDNIYRGRIEMDWLQDTFQKLGNDSIEVERIRYARAYILEIIKGYLMPDLSRNLVHLSWLLKLVDLRAAGELSWGSAMLATLYRDMCRATNPNKAKIRGYPSPLQSWARFRFSFLRPIVNHPYTFPLIMRFRQPILVTPKVLDDEHKIDLWSSNAYWPVFFSEYIKIWENCYDHLPICELIIVLELAYAPDYMPWFRIHDKPYLLLDEQRRRQIRVVRKRRGPLNLMRMDDGTGPSTVPAQSPGPMHQVTTLTLKPLQIMPGAYPSLYMYLNPYMFPFPSPMPSWNAWPGASPFPMTPTQSKIYRPSS
ncbi:hypothetical protein CXB51_016739 [Gossypium anomalum]|uniref:Aminotransferase-like plant mobile domain-containing protein n=1 Tax=Gossypium anomalum TaxID=47600 RepID=A0A8J5Z4W2_9ROSI|nr:hypothetical protein CXB51_016739 [Gossypium anomalum]